MKRWDIINALMKSNNLKSFLEIGLDSGICRDKVNAEYKVSVDPDERTNNPTYLMTSDEFFAQNKETFDLVFVDGLHHAEQVLRDIENSLECLNDGGVIVCHDMLPNMEIVQRVPRENAVWTGDCWKAWAKLRGTRKDLSMYIVESDWGVGVIQKGKQKINKELDLPMSKYDWEFFCMHRDNFITKSTNEFIENLSPVIH
jgi:SAM-dependent methyltransferase